MTNMTDQPQLLIIGQDTSQLDTTPQALFMTEEMTMKHPLTLEQIVVNTQLLSLS